MWYTMNTFLILCSLAPGIIGVLLVVGGWKERKTNQLIAGTSTIDIRTIESEGLTAVNGTISGPVNGSEFVSPIGQTDDTVLAAWNVEEYIEPWQQIASGVESIPFRLDDGTGQIQVTIEDGVTWRSEQSYDVTNVDVTWKSGEADIVEDIGVEADPPAHITTFVHDHDIEEQSGAGISLDGSTTYRSRRCSEWTIGPGDEIYLHGHVRAAEGATTVLHPTDAIITPADNEPFILSDISKDELDHRTDTNYRTTLALSAGLFVISAGLIVAGLTL